MNCTACPSDYVTPGKKSTSSQQCTVSKYQCLDSRFKPTDIKSVHIYSHDKSNLGDQVFVFYLKFTEFFGIHLALMYQNTERQL